MSLNRLMRTLMSTFRRGTGAYNERFPRSAIALSIGLCIATGTLVWLGHITTTEWDRASEQLLERRQAEALSLVGLALTRDMRGAWTSVIAPMNLLTIDADPPYDLIQLTASAFARFPYPESFIIWKSSDHGDGLVYAFNRADRPAHWDTDQHSGDPFPVTILRDPLPMRDVVATLRGYAASGDSFVVLERDIEGVPYQVIAHLMIDSRKPATLQGLAAFTVNLKWLKQAYFGPLLTQVARIGGYEDSLSLAVIDDDRKLVAVGGSPPAGTDIAEWSFPVVFLDLTAVSRLTQRLPTLTEYSVQIRTSNDGTHLAAVRGRRQAFSLMALAAIVSIAALGLMLRAINANVVVAEMKSDFVSSITHELKTPLALIRLVADTLSSGRYSSKQTIQDYARLLSQGTARLSQSIDGLLAFARSGDPDRQQHIELRPADIGDLIEHALEYFRPSLAQLEFHLEVDAPNDLPPVLADRPAIVHVMENLIDNALKYSVNERSLKITARANGKFATIMFADRGIGIPKEEIGRVFDRFYRGRNVLRPGSGLGLTIAKRILQFHGGEISISSTVNGGTEVKLTLVTAESA